MAEYLHPDPEWAQKNIYRKRICYILKVYTFFVKDTSVRAKRHSDSEFMEQIYVTFFFFWCWVPWIGVIKFNSTISYWFLLFNFHTPISLNLVILSKIFRFIFWYFKCATCCLKYAPIMCGKSLLIWYELAGDLPETPTSWENVSCIQKPLLTKSRFSNHAVVCEGCGLL